MLSWAGALEIGLDRLVLLVELRQIWNDVLDNIGVWQWVDLGLLLGIGWNTACFFVSPDCPSTPKASACAGIRLLSPKILTQASKSVDSVNIHGARSANAFSAGSAESKSWVDLVLNANERIQHHRSGLVEIQGICLHLWLLRWSVWVPSVDVEGLGLCVFAWCWLGDGAGLGGWGDLGGRCGRIVRSNAGGSFLSATRNGGESASSRGWAESGARRSQEAR